MTNSEKIGIAHAALIEHRKHEEIAKEYRIKRYTVSKIVSKSNKNPKFFEEIRAISQAKETKRETIANFVN